jgi:hypothetical protein
VKIAIRSSEAARKAGAATRVAALVPVAVSEIENSGAFGVTGREMARRHKDHDEILCLKALSIAGKQVKAKISWTMVRPPIPGTLQECRYHMPGVEIPKEDA